MRVFLGLILLVCCCGAAVAQEGLPVPEKETRVTAGEARKFKIFRGEFLRTEIVRVELIDLYDCQLAPGTLPEIAVLVKRKQHQIFHEVKVFQAVQMQVKEQENAPSLPEYHPLKNRILYGEETTRDHIQNLGVWRNEEFSVNGCPARTDDRGRILDRRQSLFGVWDFFDLLENRRFRLKISHAKMGEQELEIYRIIPRRKNYDERNLDEDVQNDILWANDIDFSQMSTDPERKKLNVSLVCEKEIQPGKPWEIKVTVENYGKAPTCCLLGRTFSSELCLNGRLFYFGTVPPGEKRSFTRLLKIPEGISSDVKFVDLVFSDSWNPLPKLRQKLKLAVR